MGKSILQERLSKEQLILNEVYNKGVDEPTTIEELTEKLEMPRTTLVQYLSSLEDAGFIHSEKKDRTIHFYQVREIAQRIRDALKELQSAYAFALTFIQQKRLRELEGIKKNEGANRRGEQPTK